MKETPSSNNSPATLPPNFAIRKETVRIKIPPRSPMLPSTPVEGIDTSAPKRAAAPRPGLASSAPTPTSPSLAVSSPTPTAPSLAASSPKPTSLATSSPRPTQTSLGQTPKISQPTLKTAQGKASPSGPAKTSAASSRTYPKPGGQAAPSQPAQPAPKSKKKWILIIIGLVVAAEIAGMYFWQQNREKQKLAPKPKMEVLIPPLKIPSNTTPEEEAIRKGTKPPKPKPKNNDKKNPSEAPEKKGESHSSPASSSDKIKDEKHEPNPDEISNLEKTYEPDDDRKVLKLKKGTPVTIHGVLKNVELDHADDSIIFYFSKPSKVNELRGKLPSKFSSNTLKIKDFEHLIDQEITMLGNVAEKYVELANPANICVTP
jgi:hypothetical protein